MKRNKSKDALQVPSVFRANAAKAKQHQSFKDLLKVNRQINDLLTSKAPVQIDLSVLHSQPTRSSNENENSANKGPLLTERILTRQPIQAAQLSKPIDTARGTQRSKPDLKKSQVKRQIQEARKRVQEVKAQKKKPRMAKDANADFSWDGQDLSKFMLAMKSKFPQAAQDSSRKPVQRPWKMDLPKQNQEQSEVEILDIPKPSACKKESQPDLDPPAAIYDQTFECRPLKVANPSFSLSPEKKQRPGPPLVLQPQFSHGSQESGSKQSDDKIRGRKLSNQPQPLVTASPEHLLSRNVPVTHRVNNDLPLQYSLEDQRKSQIHSFRQLAPRRSLQDLKKKKDEQISRLESLQKNAQLLSRKLLEQRMPCQKRTLGDKSAGSKSRNTQGQNSLVRRSLSQAKKSKMKRRKSLIPTIPTQKTRRTGSRSKSPLPDLQSQEKGKQSGRACLDMPLQISSLKSRPKQKPDVVDNLKKNIETLDRLAHQIRSVRQFDNNTFFQSNPTPQPTFIRDTKSTSPIKQEQGPELKDFVPLRNKKASPLISKIVRESASTGHSRRESQDFLAIISQRDSIQKSRSAHSGNFQNLRLKSPMLLKSQRSSQGSRRASQKREVPLNFDLPRQMPVKKREGRKVEELVKESVVKERAERDHLQEMLKRQVLLNKKRLSDLRTLNQQIREQNQPPSKQLSVREVKQVKDSLQKAFQERKKSPQLVSRQELMRHYSQVNLNLKKKSSSRKPPPLRQRSVEPHRQPLPVSSRFSSNPKQRPKSQLGHQKRPLQSHMYPDAFQLSKKSARCMSPHRPKLLKLVAQNKKLSKKLKKLDSLVDKRKKVAKVEKIETLAVNALDTIEHSQQEITIFNDVQAFESELVSPMPPSPRPELAQPSNHETIDKQFSSNHSRYKRKNWSTLSGIQARKNSEITSQLTIPAEQEQRKIRETYESDQSRNSIVMPRQHTLESPPQIARASVFPHQTLISHEDWRPRQMPQSLNLFDILEKVNIVKKYIKGFLARKKIVSSLAISETRPRQIKQDKIVNESPDISEEFDLLNSMIEQEIEIGQKLIESEQRVEPQSALGLPDSSNDLVVIEQSYQTSNQNLTPACLRLDGVFELARQSSGARRKWEHKQNSSLWERKNEQLLFEKSQKSPVVSVQRSRRSQRESHPTSRQDHLEDTHQAPSQQPQLELESNFRSLRVSDQNTGSPAQIPLVENQSELFINTSPKQSTVSEVFDEKQFEVESLDQFLNEESSPPMQDALVNGSPESLEIPLSKEISNEPLMQQPSLNRISNLEPEQRESQVSLLDQAQKLFGKDSFEPSKESQKSPPRDIVTKRIKNFQNDEYMSESMFLDRFSRRKFNSNPVSSRSVSHDFKPNFNNFHQIPQIKTPLLSSCAGEDSSQQAKIVSARDSQCKQASLNLSAKKVAALIQTQQDLPLSQSNFSTKRQASTPKSCLLSLGGTLEVRKKFEWTERLATLTPHLPADTPDDKSSSSFYRKTAEIIQRVNSHVRSIKQTLSASKSQDPQEPVSRTPRSPALQSSQGGQGSPQPHVSEGKKEETESVLSISSFGQQPEDIKVTVTEPEEPKDLVDLVAERVGASDQEPLKDALSVLVFEALTQTEIDHMVGFLSSQGKLHEAQEQLRMAHQITDTANQVQEVPVNPEVLKAISPQKSPTNQIPQQISDKQAQIQKELSELQQLVELPAETRKESNLIAGIDTSLETVESYMEDIFSQIRERGPQFLTAFMTPVFRDPLDMLQVLKDAQSEYALEHTLSRLNQNLLQNFQLNNSMLCILNVQLYLTLEKERDGVIKEAIEQIRQQSEEDINEEELTELISEADHIHNKAIFDAVNEAMNLVRPFGLEGEPMPWASAPRKNPFLAMGQTEEDAMTCLEKVITKVKIRVSSWASTDAGALASSPPKLQVFSLQAVLQDQQRQRAIESIIASELQQPEDANWSGQSEVCVNQVKLELADRLFDFLVEDTIATLGKVQPETVPEPVKSHGAD